MHNCSETRKSTGKKVLLAMLFKERLIIQYPQKKLAADLLNHSFFLDFFFFAIELSDSDSYRHFTNFLDTDMHSLMILRSFDFVALCFVLLHLLRFPSRAEHASQYAFR